MQVNSPKQRQSDSKLLIIPLVNVFRKKLLKVEKKHESKIKKHLFYFLQKNISSYLYNIFFYPKKSFSSQRNHFSLM